jgi:surface protein
LQPGLHYLNFRAQGSDGQWGALSRFIVYLRADTKGTADMAAYEYWMDTDYANRATVAGTTVSSPFTVDISNLQPGLHYLNFRAQGSDGQWGALSRFIVYLSDAPAAANVAAIDYWIDSNLTNVQRQQVTNNTVEISMDISGLPGGTHTFYLEGIDGNGNRNMLNSYEFTVEAGEAGPYAVLSENNTVLTFYYDDLKVARNGMSVGPFTDDNPLWYGQRESITKVVFDESFAYCTTLTSTAYWFNGCSLLSEIVGINNLKTDNVTDMGGMFSKCSALTSLDVSHFKTDNVTNMDGMFKGCSGLTSLDVSGFKTDKVTVMEGLFRGCQGLTSLDLSSFNTAQVTQMSGMFRECTGLTTLNLGGFNTSNVTVMEYMFNSCTNMATLDLSSFNTAKVEDMDGMFNDCPALTTIYVGSDWSTAAVTNGNNMFTGCTNLVGGKGTTYDANHNDYTYARIDGGPNSQTPGYFTLSGAQPWVEPDDPEPYAVLSDNNTVVTFYYDDQKKQRGGIGINSSYVNGNLSSPYGSATKAVIDASFAGYKPTSTACWFMSCPWLTTITGMENLKTQDVTNMDYMFWYCSSLTSLDLSGFNTQNVTSMREMFAGCSNLTSLDVTGFNTQNVTEMGGMFINCGRMTSLDLSGFNTQNVTDMEHMFAGCSNLTSLDLSSFNTQNVTIMKELFYHCPGLTTIYVGNGWSTATVTDGSSMFYDCFSLVGGKGTIYDPAHVDYTYARIDGGPNSETPGYFTRSGDQPWVEPGDPEPYAVLSENNTVLTFYYDTDKEQRNGMSVGPFDYDSERWGGHQGEITSVVFDASFADCTTLASTAYWFHNFSSLTAITGIENLKTDNVTRMNNMFSDCSRLTTLDVGNFKTDKVTSMNSMFYNCSGLTNLDVSNLNTDNVTNMSVMFAYCSGLTSLDVSHFNTQNVNSMYCMFYNSSSLISLNLSSFNTANVTSFEGIFSGCSSLASIQAGSANVPAVEYSYIYNPNLLVYVNKASQAPEGVQNVVINGQAKEIILVDAAEGNNNWFCPQEFRAEKISYSREFKQRTQIGVSRGWESIALPFTVQNITHESKGTIAPFGNDASDLHFWLRRLGRNGLASSQRIEANTPYVISMPNTDEYPERYNLSGRVTFSAENVMVPVTDPVMDETNDLAVVPTFLRMAANEDIYALNVGEERNGHPEGSIFERNYREVRPFEAYTLHQGTGPAPQYFALGDLTTTDVGDALRLNKKEEINNYEWFTLDGRKLDKQPTQKGVYIHNGAKVVIK